ncbi:MAG: 3-mercaptopyruvate sulfurtransferase [Alphaproteobacteria bacterium]
MTEFGPLVEAEWLAERLDDPRLRILDASWYLPAMERSGRDEHAATRIGGARYFDIDEIADQESGLPHMLPSAEAFADAVGAMGIANDSQVVVYDAMGAFSAPRVWWMFRTFGHAHVAVLNGGLHKWKAGGHPVTNQGEEPSPVVYQARLREDAVHSVGDVEENLNTGAKQVADARAPGRFSGGEPEARPGVRSGHIPGSVNVPFDRMTDKDSRRFLEPDALAQVFEDAGVDLSQPIITSCGSGVTACVLALGLELAGCRDYAVYDGSWTEWGGRHDLPIGP